MTALSLSLRAVWFLGGSMSTLTEKYEQIKEYCGKIEEADYDFYKLYAPVSAQAVDKWEADNGVKLPEGYKSFLMLSNGFEMGSAAEIYPLERISPCTFPEYEGYFFVGGFIGDGSMLVCDRSGSFFKLDHVYGLEETTFEEFLDDWIISRLEDDLLEISKMNKDE